MTYSLDARPDTPWPPLDTRATLNDIREWATVWTNDDRDLLTTPAGGDSAKARGTWLTRRRTDPQSATRARTLVTMPIGGDIAATSADLLFGDPIPLTPDAAATTDTKTYLDALTGRIALDLHAAADMTAGIGGAWLVPRWDATITDHAVLDIIGQDQVFPETRLGILTAATIVQTLTPIDPNSPDVWRHFERHEPGIVHHQLRRGTTDTIGMTVPLTDHPDTAYLADLVTVDGTGIPLTSLQGADGRGAPRGLLPTPIVNGYNRRARSWTYGPADFGRSSTLRLIDMLNETMSGWAHEIRVGKKRILIAKQLLDQNNRLDLDDEVFAPIELDGTGADPIRVVDFTLRTDQYAQTAGLLVEKIVSMSGYAPQTFGIHVEGAISGTAHALRELRTHRTTGRKQAAWAPAIARAARWMLAIDRDIHSAMVQQPEAVTVVWPETDVDEPKARAETLEILGRAQAASIETRVRLAQPDLTPEQVQAEVDAIARENGAAFVAPDLPFTPDSASDPATQ